MSKRRRTSSVASRTPDEEMEIDVPQEPLKKKKKIDPAELCHQLYETIRNFKKDDGSLLCDAFIRVPKRRQEPAYYEVVSNPIDLLKVQQKLKTDEYEDVDDLATDIQLMVNNAKAFYKKSSQEYKDACELWDLFLTTKSKFMDIDIKTEENTEYKGKIILKVGKLARRAAAAEAKKQDVDNLEDASESSNTTDDDINIFEELFTAVMMATDADNRPLHTVFQLLPSKKRYPEYYDVIENPVDLKLIATKVQQNKYVNLAEMEKDLLQMTKNACMFNEPGSQIYKDAKALRKIIIAKKLEVEQGKLQNSKGSERIRNKRLRGTQTLSAITAALEEEESDDGEAMDEETEVVDAENPQWQLFEYVKSSNNNQGHCLSEPFWKLPSKRFYPGYYKEIKNPISLSQIKAKLKRGDYGTLSELAGDMNIMFENAKQYNRPDSKLYKDAVKLQRMMQTKVQEFLEIGTCDSESDGDSDERTGTPKRKPRGRPPASSVVSSTTSASSNTPSSTASPAVNSHHIPALSARAAANLPMKKRLQWLVKCLRDFVTDDGRQPILMFMEKPSKKLYPDYFQVIAEPIDMLTIEANIKNDKYNSEDEILSDFKLMFNNCRQYNEEGSVIYEDANKLEDFFSEKLGEIQEYTKKIKKMPESGSGRVIKKTTTLQAQKLKTLYDTIRDYRDPKNRQLSLIFLKLPSKSEYPDYYEVIKRPIDLEKISQKLKSNQYETLEDMVSDFVLMFDNACKYNEPDSQIYKDALMLQRVALQTKLQLREDEEAVPDVTAAVQELLTSLFISIYNHQDEEGRCFSDSMAELPEHDEVDGVKVRALSLDLIKRRLDRGLYKRLDTFQEDIFACLERARRLSRTDSQVFEDSIELQSAFIRQRDDLCRGGDLLHSPALSYTLHHLAAAVEVTRQNKLIQEQPDDETETRSSDDSIKDPQPAAVNSCSGDCVSYNQQVYRVGDFVYTEPKERGMEMSIVLIERLWTSQDGQPMLYGNYFFRPNETYHVTTRKFLEKELFRTDIHVAIPLDKVHGLCCVVFVKDYFRSRPEGFAEKDVYVCESRYSVKARAFKKIKGGSLKSSSRQGWPAQLNFRLVPREEALEPKRVMSVFRERVEKHKEEIAELEEREKFIEKEKPNVEMFHPLTSEGFTYYEQFNAPFGLLRTGDCVYVRTEIGRQLIAQVDSIWTNKQGATHIRGPWLVTPPEIPHAPTRLFYKQEVFLSTLEDTNPVENIVGKCAVLEHGEYISCRPTEIPEIDVYVCESLYDEARRQVRPLPVEGLKKYSHSSAVMEDEIYFFRRLINPPKIGSDSAQMAETKGPLIYESVSSPLLNKLMNDPDVMMEDSLDGPPPSVGSGGDLTPIATPISSKKKPTGRKLVTGYILYSSDVRRTIAANNPESSFGEISRIVGNEWRNLPSNEKQSWEEKAAKVNEETAAKAAEQGQEHSCPSPAPLSTPVSVQSLGPDQVYECLWDSCDWQFEDLADCIEHCVQEPNGHVHTHFALLSTQGDVEYQCQWRGCGRIKKSAPPFPNMQRLSRHVRDVHLLKNTGRCVPSQDRSKNFVPSRKNHLNPGRNILAAHQGQMQHAINSNSQSFVSAQQIFSRQTPSPLNHIPNINQIAAPQNPPEPMFVSVPPRPQRLLHSEAYIRYIEGLSVENKHISNWDRQLRATPENLGPIDPTRLPANWLAHGAGQHGNISNALWTLRDLLMRDAFSISKVV